ncbi:MAG: TrbG/VirB9 family P-type conjugative transfer protein, partial [Selenomonadaceae bacterium]|nr:TrbG/VirB9 family P-type conjugative transfer protein [Selenomonadaceae bacterium]
VVSAYNPLVNPSQTQKIDYTQDAANSQDNSTVVFKYAPNQLYKIYCRAGYLTDLSLKKGETISFVGGGDTSAWAVEKTTVDGVPHIYIKPTVATNTTNLIITTNKRSYQLILNTSDWYNPMVTWTYGQEETSAINLRDEQSTISKINGNVESLNFNYKISGQSSVKPVAIFDDGEKTFLRFDKIPKRLPSLFIRNKGKIFMTNYKIRDNCYIVDTVADEIELRISDKEILRIKNKR